MKRHPPLLRRYLGLGYSGGVIITMRMPDDPSSPPLCSTHSFPRSIDWLPHADDRRDRRVKSDLTHPHKQTRMITPLSAMSPQARLPQTPTRHTFNPGASARCTQSVRATPPARCASIVSIDVIARWPCVWAQAAARRCRVVAAVVRGERGRPNSRWCGAQPGVVHFSAVQCHVRAAVATTKTWRRDLVARLELGSAARRASQPRGSLAVCLLRSCSRALSSSPSSWRGQRSLEVRRNRQKVGVCGAKAR